MKKTIEIGDRVIDSEAATGPPEIKMKKTIEIGDRVIDSEGRGDWVVRNISQPTGGGARIVSCEPSRATAREKGDDLHESFCEGELTLADSE